MDALVFPWVLQREAFTARVADNAKAILEIRETLTTSIGIRLIAIEV